VFREPNAGLMCPSHGAASGVSWGALPTRLGVKDVDVALVGRPAEREALGGLLARAAEGYSGALPLWITTCGRCSGRPA